MNSPMFSLQGQVINVFEAPKGVTKEGKDYGGQDKIQILGDIPLDNGDFRKDLVTLTTDQGAAFKAFEGKRITLPVSFYSPARGTVNFFLPKGFKPSAQA